jgi:hypothetical protein
MGVMEATFWTKQKEEPKTSCDGGWFTPVVAGMMSALWANACD